MARTDSDAVGGIIEVDSNISLTPFIEVANSLVTDLCTNDDYTDAKLELIERWLAAHFYAIRDQRIASETAGPVTETKQYKVGLHLDQTIYGQQAMLIDTEGNLAGLNQRMKGKGPASVGMNWLGSETTDSWYDQ